ncbi:sporulation protein YlmC with PRC-barrel domain [Catenulispora sp. GAS73]|uniref:PRC-barrel domain-containing protein n=1 Tax=Catenulispora sp. GAS73 TaxID=3156269 RepID=UPI0035194CE8
MSIHMDFTIGSEVECGDGVCGELQRVVVDPVTQTLTHLVVDAKHEPGTGRLVPISLARSTDGGIVLGCTSAEFDRLEPAEETHFLNGARGEWGYQQEQLLAWPFYGLGMGAGGTGSMAGLPSKPRPVAYDRVPVGEVQVRRGEAVHATDGDIGRVQGLVVDPADHAVTHILLDEGHLCGKKRVAIPIGAMAAVDAGGVQLRCTKDEVRDLPPVDLDEQD